MELKRDPYNNQQKYNDWLNKIEKDKYLKGISRRNSKIIVQHLKDMALGYNVSLRSKKGSRSYIRLNAIRSRLIVITRILEKRGINDLTKVTEKDLHKFNDDMRKGIIKTKRGAFYKSAADYVKTFTSFWHWYMKIMKKKGKVIEDITSELDKSREKAKFVYFTKEDFERIVEKASHDLKAILALAFDSGMRVTELMNIKVSDFSSDYREVTIREETSKTFGRKIKLMLCSKQIREYVNKIGLKKDDFYARINPPMINKELKRIGKEMLSPEQVKFKNLTLYDFRHSSACFWLPKYKSESALKYRFGWKKSDMIHYYTEFLGMKDTITQDDLYDDITKAELEKEVEKLKKHYNQLSNVVKKLEAWAARKLS
jgi:integrase